MNDLHAKLSRPEGVPGIEILEHELNTFKLWCSLGLIEWQRIYPPRWALRDSTLAPRHNIYYRLKPHDRDP